MTSPRYRSAIPAAGLIGAQIAVGSAAIFARRALDYGVSSTALAAWRLTVAGAVVVSALALRPRFGTDPSRVRLTLRQQQTLCAAGGLLAAHFALWFASLQRLSIAVATMLVCTGPLWAAIAEASLLRRRVERRFWLAMLVAGVGLALLLHAHGRGGKADIGGFGLALGGAAAIAGYLLLAESIRRVIGSGQLVAWTYTSAAIVLWSVAFLGPIQSVMRALSFPAIMWVVGLALLPQLVGHTLLNWALRYYSASVVAASTLLEPAVAAALAFWLLNQPLTLVQAAGMGLTGAAVATIVNKKPGSRQSEGATPQNERAIS